MVLTIIYLVIITKKKPRKEQDESQHFNFYLFFARFFAY